MTLFHIDGERGLRGGERQLLYLACGLRGRGRRNVIVCRKGAALSAEAAALGFERLHLPFLGEWDAASAFLLRRRALREPSPVLHAHTGHAAALARLACLGTRVPWIAHRRVDFHLRAGLSRGFKYAAAFAVVAVSEGVRRVLLEDGLRPEQLRVVRDCLPLGSEEASCAGLREPLLALEPRERAALREEFSRQWGWPAQSPWIINAAALVPHKDHETLLRAAAQVLEKRPEARFIVLGEGPLLPSLEALRDKLGLREGLVFAGFRPDAARCIKVCDLFVLSSWGEGMGSVLLEAMACGTPVVATRAGGIPEAVEDGVSGLLAPARDPERLARRILETIDDREAAGRRARAGLARVRDFSLGAAAEKMENIYREALARAGDVREAAG